MRTVTGLAVLGAWVGVWGRVTTPIVVTGVLLGVLAAARFRPSPHVTLRPGALAVAAGHLVVLVLRANATVVTEVVRELAGRRHPYPEGIVDVRLQAPPGVDVLVANVVTMTPGTAVLDLDRGPDGTVLRVHTLRLDDAVALRAEVARIDRLATAAFARTPHREVTP